MRKNRHGRTTEDVTLTDTGSLVALVDKDDQYHAQAAETLTRLPKTPLLTTWPCLTEAMYLLHRSIGYTAQEALWRLIEKAVLRLYPPSEDDWRRMRALMAQYEDAPMDLADASLVAAAEALSLARVFTFDRHFYAYRMANGSVLEVVP